MFYGYPLREFRKYCFQNFWKFTWSIEFCCCISNKQWQISKCFAAANFYKFAMLLKKIAFLKFEEYLWFSDVFRGSKGKKWKKWVEISHGVFTDMRGSI